MVGELGQQALGSVGLREVEELFDEGGEFDDVVGCLAGEDVGVGSTLGGEEDGVGQALERVVDAVGELVGHGGGGGCGGLLG